MSKPTSKRLIFAQVRERMSQALSEWSGAHPGEMIPDSMLVAYMGACEKEIPQTVEEAAKILNTLMEQYAKR